MGTRFTNDRGFRDQQLAATPRARTRLYNAQAALIEKQLEPQQKAIIGGQLVDVNNNEQVNAAGNALREREAMSKFLRGANFGSSQIDAAALSPGTTNNVGVPTTPLTGTTPAEQAAADTAATVGANTAQNITGVGTGAPLASAGNPAPVGGANMMSEPATTPKRGFRAGQMNRDRRTVASGGESPYDVVFGSDREFSTRRGYADGGVVDKPRTVKQPGMRQMGKVQMPKDPNEPSMSAREAAQQQEIDRMMQEAAGRMNPKYPDDAKAQGYRGGGAVCKRGMRGYAMGGQIGNPAQDDGRDTVDVSVREGEYMLNPPTVAAFGGGSYDAGKQVLDGISTAVNGVPPGPVPVDEAGEAMEGYANGGGVRMGFADNGTFFVNQAGEASTTLGMHPKWQRPVDLRGMTQAVVDKGQHLLRSPTLMRGANVMNKAGPYVLPAVEGAQTAAVAADPNMTGLDTATQAASGIGRLGSAGVGAAYGSQFGPIGTLVGGIGGYMVGDELIQGGRKLYNWLTDGEMDTRDPFDRVGEGEEAPPPPAPLPYGRAFGEGEDIQLPTNGLRSAAEAVAPGEMNVVQETGGPRGEVIVREDVDGVPTFTNLRRGGFDGRAANLQREADVRASKDGLRRQQLLENIAREREMFDAATAPGALDRQAKSATTGGGDMDKRIRQRFQTPQFDEDGNVTGYIEDQNKIRIFEDTMAQLGLDLNGMTQAQQNQVFENFEPVYRDTMMAMRAAREQGKFYSDVPRTGTNTLRAVPNREITLGDVWGPQATLGDWWAGWGNDDPILNSYVEDPDSGAVIPARRAVGQGGLSADDIARYKIVTGKE